MNERRTILEFWGWLLLMLVIASIASLSAKLISWLLRSFAE